MEEKSNMLLRARMGDRDVLYRLYCHTFRRCWFAASVLLPENAVSEVLQQSYTVSFQNLKYLKDGDSFTVWMDRIVVNFALRTVAKLGLNFIPEETADAPQKKERVVSNTPENREKVLQQWKNMPQNLQAALLLDSFEKLPVSEMTAQLGQKESLVTGWLNLAYDAVGRGCRNTDTLLPVSRVLEIALLEDLSQTPVSEKLFHSVWESTMDALTVLQQPAKETSSEKPSVKVENPETENTAKKTVCSHRAKRHTIAVAVALALTLTVGGFAAWHLLQPKQETKPQATLEETLINESSEKPQDTTDIDDEDLMGFANAVTDQVSGELSDVSMGSDGRYQVSIDVEGESPQEETTATEDTSETETGTTENTAELHQTITDQPKKTVTAQTQVVTTTPSYLKMVLNESNHEGTTTRHVVVSGTMSGNQLDTTGTGITVNAVTQEMNYAPDADVVMTIMCTNVDTDSPIQLTVDEAMAEAIGETGILQILLNDESHGMILDSAALHSVTDTAGRVLLRYEILDDTHCTISFTAPDGTILDPEGRVDFILPGNNITAVAYDEVEQLSTAVDTTYDSEKDTTYVDIPISGQYRFDGITTIRPYGDLTLPNKNTTSPMLSALNSVQELVLSRSPLAVLSHQLVLMVFLAAIAYWTQQQNRKKYAPPLPDSDQRKGHPGKYLKWN